MEQFECYHDGHDLIIRNLLNNRVFVMQTIMIDRASAGTIFVNGKFNYFPWVREFPSFLDFWGEECFLTIFNLHFISNYCDLFTMPLGGGGRIVERGDYWCHIMLVNIFSSMTKTTPIKIDFFGGDLDFHHIYRDIRNYVDSGDLRGEWVEAIVRDMGFFLGL